MHQQVRCTYTNDDPAQSIRNDSAHSNHQLKHNKKRKKKEEEGKKIQFEMKPPLGCVSDNRIIIDRQAQEEEEEENLSKTSPSIGRGAAD